MFYGCLFINCDGQVCAGISSVSFQKAQNAGHVGFILVLEGSDSILGTCLSLLVVLKHHIRRTIQGPMMFLVQACDRNVVDAFTCEGVENVITLDYEHPVKFELKYPDAFTGDKLTLEQ